MKVAMQAANALDTKVFNTFIRSAVIVKETKSRELDFDGCTGQHGGYGLYGTGRRKSQRRVSDMAKKLGSLDTNKMYASLFGGPQEAAEEQKPEKESEKRLEAETQEEPKASTKLPSVAQKPSKIPPSMEAIGLEEKPRQS